MTPEQINSALSDHLLSNDINCDWTLRHGRTAALFVALKEAPEVIYTPKEQERVCKIILGCLAADKVQIVMNGIRACGYLFQHLMMQGETIPQTVLGPFVRCMNNNSNEVKQLMARVCIHLARNVPSDMMSLELMKAILPMLVNGTKEKNGYVKANSELALIAVLRLKMGDEDHQVIKEY